jgi:hypothetical protein
MLMIAGAKNRLISVMAVRPPTNRAVKPACRAYGIAGHRSPERQKVRNFSPV